MPYQEEIKAIKLLQDKSKNIAHEQDSIMSNLDEIKASLSDFTDYNDPEFLAQKQNYIEQMTSNKELEKVSIKNIYQEAEARYKNKLGLADILTLEDFRQSQQRVDEHITAFNKKYSLDAWDYAIAVSCGLFAGMLDIFCVKAPPKPTVKWKKEVDGVFNKWVQDTFNKCIPPELSSMLSMGNTIGSADTSTSAKIIGDYKKPLSPTNHRMRSLAHDPVLGFIFGVWDMLHGTCTAVVHGKIVSMPTSTLPKDDSIFRLLGRMCGHLLSDVNAPSANGNRGMGLPAPFMGLLQMLNKIPFGDSNFATQIEYMYVNGYDFRQFIVSSIPMTIMEVMLRVFYTIKQISLYQAPFGATMLDTMPLNLNPRFRMMLALAYGTSSSINAGKVYVTQNILNANYASWLGLAWNSFHSLKWLVYSKHNKLWSELTEIEISQINKINLELESLSEKASKLVC